VHAARSARGPFEITQPAQTQILSRSPNSPPIAAPPLLSPRRRSKLVRYCSADPRWFGTAPPFLAGSVLLRRSPFLDGRLPGWGRRAGREWGRRAGWEDGPRPSSQKKKNGRDGRKCKPGHGRDGTITNKYTREKDHGQGIQITPSTQLTSLYFGCHIIIFWLSSWPHVNNLGFCLEILNNAIIDALVDISLPSNPEDMLCFMLSSTLICQVVYLLILSLELFTLIITV
jgi:hypothetical protein